MALSTIALNSSGDVLDLAATSSGPEFCLGRGLLERPIERIDHGRQSLDWARASAVLALTLVSGRTGVTTVIESFTASNTTISVGRISTASGMPIGSGWWAAEALDSAAPCRSRNSRTRRRPSAGRSAGRSIRLSAISARSEASGASGQGSKPIRVAAATRLTSAPFRRCPPD